MKNWRTINRKFLTVLTLLIMVIFNVGQGPVFAAGTISDNTKGEKPFPSLAPMLQMRSLISPQVLQNEIGNANVKAKIGYDGRFNIGVKELQTDNWFNTIYAWPSDPWSSFTTVRVDGTDKVFGNTNDGQFLAQSNVDAATNESLWKTGEISVKQVIQAGLNPATGVDDAIQIKYVLTNTGASDHNVGLRIMLDTMVNGNDSAPFRVPGKNGMESINYEKDYLGSDVPAFWQCFNNFDNPDISAQYTMSGRNSTPPDRFTIARWGSISGTTWDYGIYPGASTGDSAVGMWWNPVSVAPGETKTITTYYGRPGVGGSQTLVLSGRQRIPYDEWSATSFNIIAYLHNNTGATLDNARLEIVPGPGIELDNNDPSHSLGTVMIGDTTQTTWSLGVTEPGSHFITVNAYADGGMTPFATAQYQVEALEPIVPPNIVLGGTNGISSDGTPVSGRVTPLTISATFDNPQAQSATLIATDANGDRYEAEMTSNNGVLWTHSFVPSQKGLWESPLTIQVIPHYPDGTNGNTLTFPIVLVDPSGYVYNSAQGEDWRLPDATVRLQYLDPDLQTWVNMSDEAYSGRMSPITNPQITGSDGRYAWDVAEGQYRVIVSRDGFDTVTSYSVIVPPPVTDLNIGLIPNDATQPTMSYFGVTEDQTYYQPVNVDLTASDDLSGVRNITYALDSETETQVDGDSATLNVSSLGVHEINFTAVDYAGNTTSGSVSFTIAEEQQEQEGFTVNVPGLNGIKAEFINPQTNEVISSSDWGNESVTVENISGELILKVTHVNPSYNVPITYTIPSTINVSNEREYTLNPVDISIPPFVTAEGVPAQVEAQVLYNSRAIDAPETINASTGGTLKELPLNSGKYQVLINYSNSAAVTNMTFTNGSVQSPTIVAPAISSQTYPLLLGSPFSLPSGLLSPVTQTNTNPAVVENGTVLYTVKVPGLNNIRAELLNPETNEVVASSGWGNQSVALDALAGDYILQVIHNHLGYDNPITFKVSDTVTVQNGGVATINPVTVKIPAMVNTLTTPRVLFGQIFYKGKAADVNQLFFSSIGGAFKEMPLNADHYDLHILFDPVLR